MPPSFKARRAAAFICLERWLARRSTRLIAISPRIRDELAGEFHLAPAEKIAVVPLGLDLGAFRDTESFRANCGKDSPCPRAPR